MDYTITYEQLDRLMKPYWDDKFRGAEFGTIEEYSDDEDWSGLIKKTPDGEILLVGYPYYDDGSTWFSNGEYFGGGWHMFNITSYEFNMSMLRYIEKNYDVHAYSIL